MNAKCSYVGGAGLRCARTAKFNITDVRDQSVKGAVACSAHLASIVRGASTIGGLLQHPVSVHVRCIVGGVS